MSLDRVELLLEQSRLDLAEQELHQILASEPNNATAHAYLSLVYDDQEQTKEAVSSAQTAIGLEPDEWFPHYVLGRALTSNRQYKEAESAANEALRMMPLAPQIYALLSRIHYAQNRWEEALNTARAGLAFAPEDRACANFEAMALVKLGRGNESAAALRTALHHDPNSPVTHATSGWVALESGNQDEAMEHFREALRLDPNSEYARSGIVESLKARNIVYRLMLRYFFWMSRLDQRTRVFVILGAVFGIRILRNAAAAMPTIEPFVMPIFFIYLAFVYLTWTADSLFNLLLQFDPFGRLALSDEEKRTANYVGGLLLVALLFFLYSLTSASSEAQFAAIGALLMVIPVSATFRREKGRSRTILTIYTGILLLIGLAALGLAAVGSTAAAGLGGLFALGIFAFTWIAAFLPR